MTINLTFRILRSFLKGDTAQALLHIIDFQAAEVRTLHQQFDGKRLLLKNQQRRELATLGRRLPPAQRQRVTTQKTPMPSVSTSHVATYLSE